MGKDNIVREDAVMFDTPSYFPDCGKFELGYGHDYLSLVGYLSLNGKVVELPALNASTAGHYASSPESVDKEVEAIGQVCNFLRRYYDAAIEARAIYRTNVAKAAEANKEE